jgi:Uma2 family endonuclease
VAAHRIIATRIASRIDSALSSRRPCNAQGGAGIVRPERDDTYFEADIAATCAPHERRQQAMPDPFLIIEILSPSTERHDRRVKLPAYRQIATVQEIVLIDSDGVYAELHRRSGSQRITEILRRPDATLELASVPIEIRLGELYDGIALAETNEA